MKICETCYPILCGLQLQPPEAKITLKSWIYTEQTGQQKMLNKSFAVGLAQSIQYGFSYNATSMPQTPCLITCFFPPDKCSIFEYTLCFNKPEKYALNMKMLWPDGHPRSGQCKKRPKSSPYCWRLNLSKTPFKFNEIQFIPHYNHYKILLEFHVFQLWSHLWQSLTH